MIDQIDKYTAKLAADRSADTDKIAFAAQDDVMLTAGNQELAEIAGGTLSLLSSLALCIAVPSLPFAEFLLKRTGSSVRAIIPRDTETRTFLHDIPIVRKEELTDDRCGIIARLLGSRKGIIVEGTGIIASGSLTVEQAYINWSSVFHSTFIMYLEDLLEKGFLLPGEEEAFFSFRQNWLKPLSTDGLVFRDGPLLNRSEILDELQTVGGYTVRRGLVDSFFGNISYSDGQLIYISQTASSLDELAGCIDPVPFDDRSTVGVTASSELVAHRRIFETTGCRAILHGHPRFSVIMSMLCTEKEFCPVADCWKECAKVRFVEGTPVVAGEIGAGGIARNVPPVITQTGCAIVYGHGVFATGKTGFNEAFSALVSVENRCRAAYFDVFDRRGWSTAV